MCKSWTTRWSQKWEMVTAFVDLATPQQPAEFPLQSTSYNLLALRRCSSTLATTMSLQPTWLAVQPPSTFKCFSVLPTGCVVVYFYLTFLKTIKMTKSESGFDLKFPSADYQLQFSLQFFSPFQFSFIFVCSKRMLSVFGSLSFLLAFLAVCQKAYFMHIVFIF